MPRTERISAGGLVYHVINRGNRRRRIFHKPADARAFVNVIWEIKRDIPMRVLGYCVMSNHWHLALMPYGDGDLPRFMHRLTTTHVRRYFEHYHDDAGGHLYQGRYKNFPCQDDGHVLTMLRYVEANALRAGLVERAEDWPFSSAWLLANGRGHVLDEWPVERPGNWLELVNEALPEAELGSVRTCVTRGRPYGGEEWVTRMCEQLGLEFTMRPRGRPRRSETGSETANQE